MRVEAFSKRKRHVEVGSARVAYYEAGRGPPLLLLHGCPFSSFIWRKVIPRLAAHHRCVAPDLLGLGDTETADRADWSLRAQAQMVIGLLDELGLSRVHLVGHDHGDAVAQLLAANNRITSELLDGLQRFDHPTLLLWGADDVQFGVEWAERLLRDIPGAVRLEVVADAGHLVMEEQPERFAACVAAFLSEPVPSPGILA